MGRYEVDAAASQGDRRAGVVRRALERLSFQLSGAQLGITVSSLVLGFVVDNAIGPLLRPLLAWIPGIDNGALVALTAALALVTATVTQMVLGELAPKNLAIARPLATARIFVPPMVLVNAAFAPVIRVLNAIANVSMRAVGLEPREELEGFRSVDDVREALRWAMQDDTAHGIEYGVLDRALGLGRRRVRDVMVPRPRVVDIDAAATLADLARLSVETGHSRFPVRDDHGRGYRGVAHVKDVLELPAAARAAAPLSAKLQPALVAPTGRDLRSMLLEMQAGNHAMAIAVDEFGHAAGIVTLEDILEELLGRIQDEHDQPAAPLVVRLGEGLYDAAGEVRRGELRTATGFAMPRGRFETLAGLLLALMQRIPTTGDTAAVGGWTLTVAAMDRRRITRVRLRAPRENRGARA